MNFEPTPGKFYKTSDGLKLQYVGKAGLFWVYSEDNGYSLYRYPTPTKYDTKASNKMDIVGEWKETVKTTNARVMSFWEARQAALVGKTVRCLDTDFDASNFSDGAAPWPNNLIDAEWRVVEEPKTYTAYVNVYMEGMFKYRVDTGVGQDPSGAGSVVKDTGCLGTLEIITDENGKLISAKNV